MTDTGKVTGASLQIHAAIDQILTEALGRSPAYFETAQATAVAHGEAKAFLIGSMGGDVSVIEPLDLISDAAFMEIAGPETLANLGAL